MIGLIIKKDLYSNFQNARIQILTATIICLTFIVSFLGIYEYRIKLDKYNNEIASNISLVNEQKVYATLYPKAIKPPQPLSVISKGCESDFGNCLTFKIDDIPLQADKVYETNSYISGVINLDLTTIFIWLFSLISILISFDAISNERQNGTLKLMFASHLTRLKFLIAKIISSMLCVSFVALSAIIIVFAIFILTPWINLNWGIIENLLYFLFITLLYIIFWIFLGIASSISSANSSTSLVRCLAIWICFLIIIPSLGKVVIGNTSFIKEKREISHLYDNIMSDYNKSRNDIWNSSFLPLINNLQFSTFEGGPDNEPIWVANPMTMNAMINYYDKINPIKLSIASQKQIILNEK
jgi:ABC-type transport system involved in multi-copper enzyme maturation permease subunit